MTGRKLLLREVVRASIPVGREPPALDWLRQNGLESVIKNQVITEFGRGQNAAANELANAARRLDAEVKRKMYVHPSTLAATIRELLQKGVDVPLEMFGAIVQKEVTVK